MGDPSDWHKNIAILKRECAVQEVPFVLLSMSTFANLLMASEMIEQLLSGRTTHEKAVDQ
jgi:hypothetical protein